MGGRGGAGKRRRLAGPPALMLLALGLGVAVGFLAGLWGFGRLPLVGPLLFREEPARTATGPVVVEGVRRLDELATVRWTESVVVTRESGGGALERFLTGERVLLVATGRVEAGVDLSRIGRDDVRVEGESVTLRLPEPEILSVGLDEGRTRVYDRDFGLLGFRPDDALVEEARGRALEEIEDAARENGILKQAERNAEASIRSFLTALGFERVRFE